MEANHTQKLNGTNWSTWKFQTKIILSSRGLINIVEGNEKAPDSTKADEYAKYMAREAKAQEIIATRMEEGPLSHILHCTSAKDMWCKLILIYEKKSTVSVHLHQQKFFNLKFDGSIRDFITNIENTSAELRQLDAAISEQMIITKILMSLPLEYKHFSSAWESVQKDEQTLENLITRLLLEEERSNEACALNEPVALVSKYNYNNNKHQKREISKTQFKQCNYCKKKGHVVNDCWFLKNKESKKKLGNNKKSSGSNAFIGKNFCDEQITDGPVFILDSGASEHMCNDKSMFIKYTKYIKERTIKIGDGSCIKAEGVGNVEVETYNGSEWVPTTLHNVLYIPSLVTNLISVTCITDNKYTVITGKSGADIMRDGEICAKATRKGNLYHMIIKNKSQAMTAVKIDSKMAESLMSWHKRLAHQNFSHIKNVLKINNVHVNIKNNDLLCESCVQGKHSRDSFPVSLSHAKEVNELIHMDLCGPFEEKSIGGSRYFLLLKDDFSKYRVIYFLERKSEVYEKVKQFIMKSKNDTSKHIKTIRSDNGTEFINASMNELLKKYGITHQTSVPYTPQQNGRIERDMRTVVEAVRAMLIDHNLPKKFWAEAANTAVYIMNRTGLPNKDNNTPLALWCGKDNQNINEFQAEFGVSVWVHIPTQKRLKLDPKSKKGIFVGYPENQKGYRVYFPQENKIETTRDIKFIGGKITDTTLSQVPLYDEEEELSTNSEEQPGTKSEPEVQQEQTVPSSEVPVERNISPETLEDAEEETATARQAGNMLLRDKTCIKPPSRYALFSFSDDVEPSSLDEAIASDDSHNWKQAMETEMKALYDNNTWDVVDKPPGVPVIDSKWVYKSKQDKEGLCGRRLGW